MLPKYRPGCHVVSFNWGRIDTGSVIVFEQEGRVYIKRIKSINGGKIFVAGDNKKASAKIAPFDRRLIIGKVIFKY